MLGIITTILRKLPKNNYHAKIYNGFKLHQSKVFNTFQINNNRILLSQSEVKLFSTTEQRTAIPPIPPWFLAYATLLIKPVARFLPPLIGVFFRKYRKDLPSGLKQKNQRNIRNLFNNLGAGLIIMLAYGYIFNVVDSITETCPYTGRRKFLSMKSSTVEKIGQYDLDTITETYKEAIVPEEHPYYERVAQVATRILKSNSDISEIRQKTWTVSVIDDTEKNAFVLPSGNIFVYTGMLSVCSNDDELGIVLAHEIAHTVLKHASELLSESLFVSLIWVVPLILTWAYFDGITPFLIDYFANKSKTFLIELPFSRKMETEADEFGLKLASKACFDIRHAPIYWAKMNELEKESEKEGENFQIPEFLSTHPSHENREINLATKLPEFLDFRTNCGCEKLPQCDSTQQKLKQIMQSINHGNKYRELISTK